RRRSSRPKGWRATPPAARAAPPASSRPFPQPGPSPRSPSSSASLCCEARPPGAAVEFIQAAEMSLRAFDKSGSGRRTGNVSCENTNLAGGSSNFCCRRLELCLVSAAARRRHRAEYDAAGTLEGVRRAFLSADRLESPGTGAAGGGTFHLCNRAIRTSTIVDDAVSDLIGLHIEMSATMTRHAHRFDILVSSLCSFEFFFVGNWLRIFLYPR